MAHIVRTRVAETASNKPNAATAFNLPDTALDTSHVSFDSVMASGDTCRYVAYSTAGFEEGLGTFTAGSPDTLARTTIYQSTNSDAAVDFSGGGDGVVMMDGGGQWARGDWASRLDYGTETLTSGNATVVVNTLHDLDIDGMTAARDFVLPATAEAGDRVAVRVSTDAPTTAAYVLQIKNSSGDTIDGTDHSSTIKTALFIKGEIMVFRCVTANSAWITEYDGRIPAMMVLRLSAGTSGTQTGGTFYAPTSTSGGHTAATLTAHQNRGNCGDVTTSRFNFRRAVSATTAFRFGTTNAVSDANYATGAVWDGATSYAFQQIYSSVSAAQQFGSAGAIPEQASGAYLEFIYRTQESNKYCGALIWGVEEVLK
jgi:hypothetical protein